MNAQDRAPTLLTVAGEDELPIYPLPSDSRVGGLDYFPIYQARFFGSTMYATATNEVVGAALSLWSYALFTQSPGGTVPTADIELAHAARYWRDMDGWARVRNSVMRGWTRVRVVDGAGETVGERLAHPVVTEVAVEMWGIVEGARGRRKGDLARKQLGRLRATLRDLGCSEIAGDEQSVIQVREWLSVRGLPQSKPDVRGAVQRIFGIMT